ncbi:Chaperone protein dnaJ 72 [Linum perenne]
MDYYKLLGIHRSATKSEIKEAFRRLAVQFHPDKHSQSSKHVRDDASLRFKQISEAYQILVDDRKRADYNLRSRSSSSTGSYHYNNKTSSSSSSSSSSHSSYQSSYYDGGSRRGGGVSSMMEVAIRFMTTRAFLLNVAFAGCLLGGAKMMDGGGERLWKKWNSGKSFEEAMESIEKSKSRRR